MQRRRSGRREGREQQTEAEGRRLELRAVMWTLTRYGPNGLEVRIVRDPTPSVRALSRNAWFAEIGPYRPSSPGQRKRPPTRGGR
jgi:hypothetical protein